ncbi:MAG: hypothetical protein EBS29_09040 [Chloroflexia bacterium]|nr:hypothetical protein [Chloroflexia bacterium]
MIATQCPQCQNPLVAVSIAANDPALSEEIRQSLALPPPPSPKQSGGLGCITLLLSFSIAVAASVIVGGIAELTNGTNFPAQGLKPGDTGIYSGIATFIVGMIALFSVFVWRQARNDAILKTKLVIWHQQKLRYENDYYCPHCQFRGSLPLPSDNKG